MTFSTVLKSSQQDLAMDDVDDEPLYDENEEIFLRQETARALLNSKPLGLPRRDRQT